MNPKKSPAPTLEFSEFDQVTKAGWLAAVKSHLNGKPLESLNWAPFGDFSNFKIPPFLNKEDIRDFEYLNNYHSHLLPE